MSKNKSKLPAPRIEVFEQTDGNWHFRVVHKNGKIANHPYGSKNGAHNGVAAMFKSIEDAWYEDNTFFIDKNGNVVK